MFIFTEHKLILLKFASNILENTVEEILHVQRKISQLVSRYNRYVPLKFRSGPRWHIEKSEKTNPLKLAD
jgi:hypothetical protein